MIENHYYRTSNTPLAAYLQVDGYTLVDVTTEPHRFNPRELEAVFLFEDVDGIHEAARRWETGKATGDLNLFYHVYRTTVGKAKMAVKVELAPQGAGEEHGRHAENICKSSALVAPPASTSFKAIVGAGGEQRETRIHKCKSSAQAAPPAPTTITRGKQ